MSKKPTVAPDDEVKTAQKSLAAAANRANERLADMASIDDGPKLIDKSVKNLRMRRNLEQVQTKLRPTEKSFSTIIHQPLVQLISELASKTVARPSGLLAGGLLAFVGGSAYLWLSHHYDLTYDFSFFLLLFVAGFALGILSEYILVLLRKILR